MESIDKMTRKERERNFRRHEILNAAKKVFSEKGFTEATLDEIASSSEFGKGTLYNYFQSKEEIYFTILDEIITGNLEILMSADKNAKNAKEFFETYTRCLLEFCFIHRESFIILVRYYISLGQSPGKQETDQFFKKHREMETIIIERIKKGIKAGEIKKLSPEKLRSLFVNMIYPFVTFILQIDHTNKETTKDRSQSIQEHVELILEVLFNGILTEKS